MASADQIRELLDILTASSLPPDIAWQDQACRPEVVCQACQTPTPFTMGMDRGSFPLQRWYLALECPSCQIRVEQRIPASAMSNPSGAIARLADVLGAITHRLQHRTTSVDFETALRQGHGVAEYDSEAQWCHCAPAQHPSIGSSILQGDGAQRFLAYANTLAEALLILPLEFGIPTDTGWQPGQHYSGHLAIAPYRSEVS